MSRPRRRRPKPPPPSLDNMLQSVREREVPDVSNSEYLDVVYVADPESEDHEIRPKLVNRRDDPVGQMHRRGQLGIGSEGYARLTAARRWQALYEKAEIGGAGCGFGRIAVDGGRYEMPDTDGRMKAANELKRVGRALGNTGQVIIAMVLAHKLEIYQVAQQFREYTTAGKRFYGQLFRHHLDTLTVEFGISVNERRSRGPMRQRDKYDTAARRMA